MSREIVVSLSVVKRCLQAQVLMVVGVMYAHRSQRESGNGEVPAEGGEDAARAVGEKGKSVAAEVILVGAADAGEE